MSTQPSNNGSTQLNSDDPGASNSPPIDMKTLVLIRIADSLEKIAAKQDALVASQSKTNDMIKSFVASQSKANEAINMLAEEGAERRRNDVADTIIKDMPKLDKQHHFKYDYFVYEKRLFALLEIAKGDYSSIIEHIKKNTSERMKTGHELLLNRIIDATISDFFELSLNINTSRVPSDYVSAGYILNKVKAECEFSDITTAATVSSMLSNLKMKRLGDVDSYKYEVKLIKEFSDSLAADGSSMPNEEDMIAVLLNNLAGTPYNVIKNNYKNSPQTFPTEFTSKLSVYLKYVGSQHEVLRGYQKMMGAAKRLGVRNSDSNSDPSIKNNNGSGPVKFKTDGKGQNKKGQFKKKDSNGKGQSGGYDSSSGEGQDPQPVSRSPSILETKTIVNADLNGYDRNTMDDGNGDVKQPLYDFDPAGISESGGNEMRDGGANSFATDNVAQNDDLSFAEKTTDAELLKSHESDMPHITAIHGNVEPSTINPTSFFSTPSSPSLESTSTIPTTVTTSESLTPPTQPTFQPLLSPPEPLQTSSVPSETLQTSSVPNDTTSQPINNARHKLMAMKKKKKKRDKKRVRKEKKTVTDVITPGKSVDKLAPMSDNESGAVVPVPMLDNESNNVAQTTASNGSGSSNPKSKPKRTVRKFAPRSVLKQGGPLLQTVNDSIGKSKGKPRAGGNGNIPQGLFVTENSTGGTNTIPSTIVLHRDKPMEGIQASINSSTDQTPGLPSPSIPSADPSMAATDKAVAISDYARQPVVNQPPISFPAPLSASVPSSIGSTPNSSDSNNSRNMHLKSSSPPDSKPNPNCSNIGEDNSGAIARRTRSLYPHLFHQSNTTYTFSLSHISPEACTD
ncbi:unnamed protein product [Ambrosiozyma monospora]|uniref:Unnamed protein product n=1 Tax=Ambrosiozyma monospora TaxID=43982 RepID=A0A9W7DHA6_AMBMO|nr:unnamed protein product [Ambrosiozyma monospora]